MKIDTHQVTAPKSTVAAQPAKEPNRSRGSDSDKDKAPTLAGSRRSETERIRKLWSTHGVDAPSTLDGQYFAQLIGLVDDGGKQHDWGGGAIAMPLHNEEIPMDLMDELTQRLSKDPTSALNITLLMPSLGRVDVRATPQNGHWNIELGFARREALKRLRPRERSCETALTEALGQPVTLSMLDEACI